MEESICRLGQTLASFCNGLESSCDALNQSLYRRPISLDCASATFIQSLNRRVSSLSGELNLLETMSFGTISLEELVGHCNQVYKKNQANLDFLTNRIRLLGRDLYSVSEHAVVKHDDVSVSNVEDMTLQMPDSDQGSILKELEDDSLFGESTSLANLGLSDACLATIASKGDWETNESDSNLHVPLKSHYENGLCDYKDQHQNSDNTLLIPN